MRPIILLTVMAVVELSGSPDRTKNLTGSNSSTRTDRRKNRNRHCRDNMSSHSRRKRKCPPRTHEDVDDDTGIPSYIKPMSPLKSAVRAKVVTERKMLKRDWCKAQPLRVEVSHPGCRTRKIINKYCYGQCNSFFIPNSDQGQPVFASCSYCKPHKTIDKYVTLTCPESSRKKVQKKIQIIEECRCVAITDLNLSLHQDL